MVPESAGRRARIGGKHAPPAPQSGGNRFGQVGQEGGFGEQAPQREVLGFLTRPAGANGGHPVLKSGVDRIPVRVRQAVEFDGDVGERMKCARLLSPERLRIRGEGLRRSVQGEGDLVRQTNQVFADGHVLTGRPAEQGGGLQVPVGHG